MVAGLYSLLALAAYDVFGALTIGVTFFPPAGLTFAAFVLLDRRRWPAIVAAIVAAEVGVDMGKGNGLWWSLGWAAANTVEPLVGASVVRRLTPTLQLTRRRSALAFLVGGIGVGPLAGAAIGATTLRVGNEMGWWSSFGHVWVGDALGVLVIAPILVVFSRPPSLPLERGWDFGAAVLAGAASVVFAISFSTDNLPVGYAVIPLIGWAAVQYGPRGVALSGVVYATIITAATARSTGPWAAGPGIDAHTQLGNQQAFLLAAIGGAWLLAIEANERAAAVRTVEAATRRWEADHEVALTLQRALMPRGVARTATTSAAGCYRPGTTTLQVGGDWYDVIVEEDSVTLVVGDVVGHGLEAAATMGRLSSATHAVALIERDPANVLTQLDLVTARMPGAEMATMVCATFEPATRRLRYSVAGHPPPLLRLPGRQGVVVLDGGRGLPLGSGFVARRSHASRDVPPGSLVVLYTDGLVERRGTSFDEVLAEFVAVLADVDPADPAVAATQLVERMLAGGDQTDDVAVLCLAVEPAERFEHRMEPAPSHLAPLRRDFGRWLAGAGIADDEVLDALVVLGEACTNAVEHAYDPPGRTGVVHIEAMLDHDHTLHLSIVDDGTWRDEEPRPHRGMGTRLMQELASSYSRSTNGTGTRVRLTKELRTRAASRSATRTGPARHGDPPGRGDVVDANGCTVVHFPPELDVSSVDGFRRVVAEAIDASSGPLYLDLAAVRYLDSRGVRLLEDAAVRCRVAGRQCTLVVPPDSFAAHLVTITGLDRSLVVVQDLDAAGLDGYTER